MKASRTRERLIQRINAMTDEQCQDLLKLLEWRQPDQRRFPRQNSANPSRFFIQDHEYQGVIKNVSADGMFIESPQSVAPGETVTIIFSLFSFEDPIRITGQIAWKDRHGFGVKLDLNLRELIKTAAAHPPEA
ncbi:MAG: PilZ domain-containing protein [Desulfobacterales bacterium]